MIDNDPDNYHSTKNSAANFGFVLHYCDNLVEGIEKIKKDKRILAVILDGKGYINPNQERGSDSQSFITKAISELNALEREEKRFIPKCVYTAWYDQLIGALEGLIRVFDKKKLSLTNLGLREMFDFLASEIDKTDEYLIRIRFQNVFDSISKSNSPIKNDAFLFSALSLVDSGKVEKIHFNNLRDLLEIFLISLNQKDKNILPNQFFENLNSPNLSLCIKFLAGKPINEIEINLNYPFLKGGRIPSHISYAIEFLKNSTSSLSHNNYDYIKWDSYAYKSCVYALCEIWLWYGLHVDKIAKKKLNS
jgi:hypothetical protein